MEIKHHFFVAVAFFLALSFSAAKAVFSKTRFLFVALLMSLALTLL